jgi:hypothetical protein
MAVSTLRWGPGQCRTSEEDLRGDQVQALAVPTRLQVRQGLCASQKGYQKFLAPRPRQ